VVRAILLDYEARRGGSLPTFGKQREPLLRATAIARAFPAPAAAGGTYTQNGNEVVSVTTSNAHRLVTGDIVWLTFTDGSGQPTPFNQGYRATVTGPTSFNIIAPGLVNGTYNQTSSTNNPNTNNIAVAMANNGLQSGYQVYLAFTNGSAQSGAYTVFSTNSGSSFNVTALDSQSVTGGCLMPKLVAAGYTQVRTNITVAFNGPHGLNPGDPFYVLFTAGPGTNGQYTVATVPDSEHFTFLVTNSVRQTQNGMIVYPLVPPAIHRSGTVSVQLSTWHMSSTDSTLTQTPLRSPTVFNFFFPDFRFPGALASAGLTTPEFQLTSDTSVAVQMNFMEGGLLVGANTNGIASFVGGNGAVDLDLGSWMTPGYTSNAGIPSLVDALNTLLTGGQLSASAKSSIVAYVANTANFPFSSTPTNSQMRDRVRAVAHLIAVSPDFIIQK
jgi:hypothetical protein